MGLKKADRGTLQFVSDFDDMHEEMAMLRRLIEQSGRSLSVSIAQADSKPTLWRHLTDWLEQGEADGLPMRGQIGSRPVGVLLGLELTLNPLSGHPSFAKIADLPLDEKVAALRDPDFRTQLLAEEAGSENPFVRALLASFGKIFVLGDPPDYEPTEEKTIAAISKHRGVSEVEVALDLCSIMTGTAFSISHSSILPMVISTAPAPCWKAMPPSPACLMAALMSA